MLNEYLIDTSIWIDLYENRESKKERLGDHAFRLLLIIKAKGEIIVITDFLIRELEMNYSIAEINGLMKPFEKILKKMVTKDKQREEARRIAKERNVPPGRCTLRTYRKKE